MRRDLLRWFDRNARPLPWRRTKDPYAIWISEIMLQQTQISTVVPYFERFLRTFPTIQHLARAPLERVLELWSGLGYYRRVRMLHMAAREVVERFGGRFPNELDLALSLPGVGRYTAGAVLSIAYDRPFTVLDGNVARVVARLLALRGNLHQPDFRKAVKAKLNHFISLRKPGDFNQALMELGQTVCVPRAPRCLACPLRKWCRARRQGKPEAYPSPRPRRATESCHLAAAVIFGSGNPTGAAGPLGKTTKTTARRPARREVLLSRGLDDGLLDGLWNFPSALGKSPAEAASRLKEKLANLFSPPIRWDRALAELRHGMTHRAITVHVYPVAVAGQITKDLGCWFPISVLERAAVSQLARKIGREVRRMQTENSSV